MDPTTIAVVIIIALVLVGAVSHFDIRAAIRRIDRSLANQDRMLERMDRSTTAAGKHYAPCWRLPYQCAA
jgi:hypothetical protein